jgi:hypothetical protein
MVDAPPSRAMARRISASQEPCEAEIRLVDLQEETGRTANALHVALVAIRKRMKRFLEGEGMDAKEIAEILSLLARLRHQE